MLRLPCRTILVSFILGAMISNSLFAQHVQLPASSQTLPIDGNTWQVLGKSSLDGDLIENGILHWNNTDASFKSFFRITSPGTVRLWINAEVNKGSSTLEVTVMGKTKQVTIDATQFKDIYAGEWSLRDTGYIAIEVKNVKRSGGSVVSIADYKIAGTAVDQGTRFVKNNEGNFFYWGRRGPSVHLGYQVPEELDVEYYYNEITVPVGEDVIGSYYMANGFSGGYFGSK